MVFTFDAPAGGEVCDFCSTSPTSRLFVSRNFILPQTTYPIFQRGPVGAWSACHHCELLINTGQWSRLTERAVRRFIQKYQVPECHEPEVREQFTHTYELFKENLIRDN